MRKRRAIAILFAISLPVFTFADIADLYTDWSESLAGNTDSNIGLTVFPVLLIPSGGRNEGMGTAYTAVAEGPELLESNPAGSVLTHSLEISFIHHDWIADSTVESLAFVYGLGSIGIGLGAKYFHVPFTAYDDLGERDGGGYFSETLATINFSSRVVSTPTFSFSFGVNFKAVYRHVPNILAASQSIFAFPIDAGLLLKAKFLDFSKNPRTNFSIGAVIKNLGQDIGDLNMPLPTITSFGIAYSPFIPLLISADFNLPLSFNPDQFPAERFDLGVGLRLSIARFFTLHGGVHLKADNPRFGIGTSLKIDKFLLTINYNVNLMSDLNPFDTFSVALALDLKKEM